jgi:hypothetical protein
LDALNLIRSWGITYVATGSPIFPSHAAFNGELVSIGKLEAREGTSLLWKIDPLPIVSGEDISFSDPTAEGLIQTGWLDPEEWGVWAVGTTADWAFRAADRPMRANVRIAGLAMPYSDDLVVHVFAGDVTAGRISLGELRFSDAKKQQEWEVLVPTAAIGSDNIVKLHFEFDPPTGCSDNCFVDNPYQYRLYMFKFHIMYEQ